MDPAFNHFSCLCERLRRNDPYTTQIMNPDSEFMHLFLNEDTSYLLGEALLGNNHVTDLRLNFGAHSEDPDDYPHTLWNSISSCKSVKRVEFSGPILSSDFTHRLLGSIARKKALERVLLYDMALGANSLSLLLRGSGRFMTTFCLKNCKLVVRNQLEIQKAVMSFHDHPYLLSFHVQIFPSVFKLLQGLVSHPILQELIIDGVMYEHRREYIDPVIPMNYVFALICAIVESPRSVLQHLQLQNFDFKSEEAPFAGLVKSTMVNQTLTKLSFVGNCKFHTSPVQHLVSIFQNHESSIRSLGVHQSCTIIRHLPQILENKIPNLKELDVSCYISLDHSVVRLLGGDMALECYKLTRLSERACETLIQVLPFVQKVKYLTVGFVGAFQHLRAALLRALEKNSSLVEAVFFYDDNIDDEEDYFSENQDDFFSVIQLNKILLYTQRNDRLPQMLLESPSSELTLSILPHLFCSTHRLQMGIGLILRSLLKLRK